MSDIVINGNTYSGVNSITVNTTSGGTTKYTEGERPTGTIEITENGTHNVADYENAVVNVAGSGEDRLQWKCDNMQSLWYEFADYKGNDLSPILNGLDTSNVKKMSGVFTNCSNLTSLDLSGFNTSNVTAIDRLFEGCNSLISLNLSNWNTSNVTTMSTTFQSCSKLSNLDLSNFNTSNVTNMGSMFYQCEDLISLDLSNFNTSKVTSMSSMFQDCELLETITNIDLIKATSISNMFNNCYALKNLTLYNIKKSLTIGSGTSYGTLLTLDSLVHTIQQLWDLTGSTSQKLTMSTASKNLIANVYVKLVEPTAEQIEADPNIIYKKNCVVCESADEGAMLITEYLTSKNWSIA